MVLLCIGAGSVYSQTSGQAQLRQAVTVFGKGQFDESLRLFRNIILDSSLGSYHGDSYFWISKCYMALGQYDNSSKNLEFFLSEYPDNQFFQEGRYQRGRLVYLQGDYETTIQILEDFISEYPNSPFIANSYYWVGESLYALGHFDEALDIFNIVVDTFPTSFKVEAARYRVSLIELKERERELLKLLKWSHEEYLKALEDFDRKERSYEQAMLSYQRTIRDLEAGGTGDSEKVAALEQQVASLQRQIEEYKQLVASMEAGAQVELPPESDDELLELKDQALELKSFYLLWLSALQ